MHSRVFINARIKQVHDEEKRKEKEKLIKNLKKYYEYNNQNN
jgi:hypothetical protein